MSRSQRAVRYRDGADARGRTAYSLAEPSLVSQTAQQAAAYAKAGVRAPPCNTVLPAITGTPTVGQTLTCSAGTFVSATSAAITRTYQWMRSDSFPISGATASTRVLAAADAGSYLRCRVTATDENGAAFVYTLRSAIIAA